MFHSILRSLFQAILRCLLAALIIAAALEVGFVLLGDSETHIWQGNHWTFEIPPDFAGEATSWPAWIGQRLIRSAVPVAMAFLAVIVTGYLWGILGARLRALRLGEWLSLPFALLAALPSVWVISCFAWYSVEVWNRPGFADEASAETPFPLLDIWHAAVIAVVIMAFPTVWLIKAATHEIAVQANRSHIRALVYQGQPVAEVFHRNVIPLARPRLFTLFDKPLSPLLGALLPVEWAFKYPGAGSLFVATARAGEVAPVAVLAAIFSLTLILVSFLREIAAAAAARKNCDE